MLGDGLCTVLGLVVYLAVPAFGGLIQSFEPDCPKSEFVDVHRLNGSGSG